MPKGIFIGGRMLGKKHSEKTKNKMSLAHKGKSPTWLNTPEERKRRSELAKLNIGDKNPNWRGGISTETDKLRHNVGMKLWRKSVFTRDNFTCQKYKIRGGNLVAHHINNFAEFPELRTAIDNGITLSEKAHKEFHKKYGIKNNTKEQLELFIKLKI